ncbi:hypothetical protein SADUNF_Sadunf06G0191500 [Salix dunnii]|uniref:Uncharacterized protein n=1 Tax=Salix dunnii TaxID=1413687 RepID=A0A835N171_9ROSI|nr:hypothetical protein SADUNF_Sadunf06G0191500 [Salix dunnii]
MEIDRDDGRSPSQLRPLSRSRNVLHRAHGSASWFHELKQLPMQLDVSQSIRNASVKLLDAFVDSMFQFADQPILSSQSNFAPVDELNEPFVITSIEGRIPDDFPEGPNPLFGGLKSTTSLFGKTGHMWIEGEGMLHALYFDRESDSGNWTVLYNSRHVETETFKLEKKRNKPSFLPAIEGSAPAILTSYLLNMLRFGKVNKDLSNTNVFEHSGKFYSIAENHLPQEIDIFSLQTLGDWDINGTWHRPFTAHPKTAPGTGELVVFGVDAMKPYMEVGVVSADGRRLVHKVDLKLKRCPLCHDIGVTERYNVILDFPLTIDLHRLIKGGPEDYARIGIMPRYGDVDSVRWFEVEPNCTFHVLNCFEEGVEVVVRGCRSLESIISESHGMDLEDSEWVSGRLRSKLPVQQNTIFSSNDELLFCRFYEWRLNMQTGEVKERNLTGTKFSMEFPMINPRFNGLKNKFGYTQIVHEPASMPKFGGLAKLFFDETASKEGEQAEGHIKVEYHEFEGNTFCTGSAFVPKEGGLEEDDGWIITFVHDEDTNTSKAYIIDTNNFTSEPVAKITLPCRVPYGFHGAFMPKRRPSLLENIARFKTRFCSSYKPLLKELQQLPAQLGVSKNIKNASAKLLDAFVDSTFKFADQRVLPSQSNFLPVDELNEPLVITSIEGKIPDDFPEGTGHIWIEGEGMLHALYFDKDNDGGSRTVVYKNKHVETETFKVEKRRNKPSFLPAIDGSPPAILLAYLFNMLRFEKVNKDLSNTNVFEHSGKFYSISENHLPQEIDIFSLQNLGDWDINGTWHRPFTAHPKTAPGTGELVVFGVDAIKPYLEVGVVSADGKRLVHKADLKLDRYNVIFDLPLTIDILRLVKGGPLLKYEKEKYARIGVMPRYGDAESTRWFEVEPNCTFHILNCFEEGDEVVVWGCRSLDSIISESYGMDLDKSEWISGRLRSKAPVQQYTTFSSNDELLFSRFYEWRLNMKTGEVKERNLTGTKFSLEFPMINPSFNGLKNKFGYTQIVHEPASISSGMPKFGGLAKLFLEETASKEGEHSEGSIKVQYHEFEGNTFCTGSAFVPKEGGLEEDDGWIITFVHDEDVNTSKVYIIDTKNFTSEPVAKFTMPCRVPYGFHGAFMPIPIHS